MPGLAVGYLTTHYPSVSHTFVRREIEQLERDGVRVTPMSLNRVDLASLPSETDRSEWSRTFVVKTAPAVLTAAAALARGGGPATLAGALGEVRGGVRAGFKRGAQLVEAAAVLHHCRQTGVRHVHAHFGHAPATVARLVALLGVRQDGPGSWSWSMTVHGWHEFTEERANALAAKAQEASFVACISDFTRAQLLRQVPLRGWSSLHTVRCGVDTASTRPRREHRSAAQTARIVVVARVAPEKGHAVLVDALAQLRSRGHRPLLHVVGPIDPHMGEQLREYAARKGVDDAMVWVGAATPEEVARQLADADVFCLPSFAEGLPVSIMEAMAAGVPVVATSVAGVPELVSDGVTGLLVPPGRADALADALERILCDAPLVDRLTAAAFERVARQHDLTRNVRCLGALFEAHAARC